MRLAMIFIGVLSTLLGCGPDKSATDQSKSNSGPKALASRPTLVELAEVKRGMIEEVLERSAALEAEAQVQVLARTQSKSDE